MLDVDFIEKKIKATTKQLEDLTGKKIEVHVLVDNTMLSLKIIDEDKNTVQTGWLDVAVKGWQNELSKQCLQLVELFKTGGRDEN